MDESASAKPRLTIPPAPHIRRRLRAIEGQTRGLLRMLDEGRPAVEVLVQIAAVQEALAQVSKLIMRGMLDTSVALAQDAATPEEAAILYDDLLDLIYKYRR